MGNGVENMKKNIWKELKKENNAKALNLEIEDQKYLDKVKSYAINQGVGMTEMEIIRKDLIGMAEEAQKNGERLEKSLGDVKEFTENLVKEGRQEGKKDQIYYCIQEIGKSYLFVIALVFFVLMTTDFNHFLGNSRFSLADFLGVFFLPCLISLWQMHTIGRFALVKKMGWILSAVAAAFIVFPNLLIKIVFEDVLPFEEIMVPNWVFLILLPLAGGLYWYGKQKFEHIIEQVVKKHSL